jgi:hypothetical protein
MEKNNKKLFTLFVAVILASVMTIFFYNAFTPGTILFGHDTINIYMPFKVFAARAAAVYHTLPLWMPHLFFGIPLIASSSLLYFYPTDLFSILVPVNTAGFYTVDLIIHMLLAFFGMFLFLRSLSLRREAAVFGGIAIMLSGFLITYVNAGHWNNIKAAALIPFIFYFTEMAVRQKSFLQGANAAIFLALQVLATGMQIMAYTYLGVLVYVLYKAVFESENKKDRLQLLSITAVGAGFIILFSALQLIPSMSYTNYSWRGEFTYKNFISWSMPPAETLSLLLPQFFGLKENYYGSMPFNLTSFYFGIIPLLLLPFVPVKTGHKKPALFLIIMSAVMLLLSLGGSTPLYSLFYYIPVFSQFRAPSRFMYLATFFVITAAAMGLNNILNGAESYKKDESLKQVFKYSAAAAGAVSVVFLILTMDSNIYPLVKGIYWQTKGNTIDNGMLARIIPAIKQDVLVFTGVSAIFFTLVWSILYKKMRYVFLAAVLLICVQFLDVYRIDRQFISYMDLERFVPSSDGMVDTMKSSRDLFRMADFGMAWGGVNKNIYYDIEGVGGMHGLMPSKYIAMERSGLFNLLAADSYMNIKYLMSASEINLPGLLKIADQGKKLYEVKGAAPRFEMSDRVINMQTDTEILNYMKSGSYDFRSVISKEDIQGISPGTGKLDYSAVVERYTPNFVSLRTVSNKDAVLVFKDSYYPDWKVKVDNKEEKLYNVNYAFMGVIVKGGSHKVDFEYSGRTVFTGALLTLLGLVLYAAVFFMEKRRASKGGKTA